MARTIAHAQGQRALQTESNYQREVEQALRKESRRRLLAEKIVRKQTQALAVTLNLAVGKTSVPGLIRTLLRAITRECSGLAASYWNLDKSEPEPEISFFLDQATGEKIEQYLQTQPAQAARLARLYRAVLSEEPGLAALKAADRRLPAGARRLFAQLGAECVLLAPLSLGAQRLGWISFLSVDPPRRINAGHLAFIEATSHQVTLCLHLARLAAAERRRALAEERARIARDMHDLPAQSFSGIMLQCEALRAEFSDLPEPAADRLEKIHRLATRGMEEVRRSLSLSRPALLATQGLADALADLAQEADAAYRVGRVRFIGRTQKQIPPRVEAPLFAIASEALHNAVRHAQASLIELALRCTPRRIALTIRDDGRGFDGSARGDAADRLHFGLSNMRARARALGADFRVQSEPGKGSVITVIVKKVVT